MDLEIINRLYLELSQVATARTRREIEAEEIIKTIGTTATASEYTATIRKAARWLENCPKGQDEKTSTAQSVIHIQKPPYDLINATQ